MYIKSVHIENYKSYKGCFDISLNDGINILVGNNEAGKSTLIDVYKRQRWFCSKGRSDVWTA